MANEAKTNTKTNIIEIEGGCVQIDDQVVSIIAGLAAMEIEGVASLAGNITREVIAKVGSRNLSKGISITVDDGRVTAGLTLNLKYGFSVVSTSKAVQEKVKSAIEIMTGLTVTDVNVRISGVEMGSAE